MTCKGWLGVDDPATPLEESSEALLSTTDEHNSNLDDIHEPLLKTAQDEGAQARIHASKSEGSKEGPCSLQLLDNRKTNKKDFDGLEADESLCYPVETPVGSSSKECQSKSYPSAKENLCDPFIIYKKSVDSSLSNCSDVVENVCDDYEYDPWGLTNAHSPCLDPKFTSIETDDSPKRVRACREKTGSHKNKRHSRDRQENQNGSKLRTSRLTPLGFHSSQIESSTSKSSAELDDDNLVRKYSQQSSRRLIRWQHVKGEESESSGSDSPPNTSDSESDSNSYTPTRTPPHTPNQSLETTPNHTAYHTPKHTLSSASESGRSKCKKVNKRGKLHYQTKSLKRSKGSRSTKRRGHYTKLDTGSSDIIGGTTECNTTATLLNETDNTNTQNDVVASPEKPAEKEFSMPLHHSLASLFSTSSSSNCDVYQRVSPGGTPWTVWYRAQSIDWTGVPPLAYTQPDDTLGRMRRRLTETR